MYLGIDLGTSSMKGLLTDNKGNIICCIENDYSIQYLHDDWSEQNPADWWNAFIEILKKLKSQYPPAKIKGISFCGQMHGLVLLDNNDCVIRPAILWNDNRSVIECKYLNEKIGKTKLIKWTGNIAFPGFTAPKLLWVKNNEPDNFNRIAKIMLPKDYLVYKITNVFASDVSDSSGTLYFDVKNKCWSEPMLKILNIKREQLPEIFESFHSIGTITSEIADITGMNKDTKVIIGGGDQAVGAIGTGTVESNQISISLGTSGVIFMATNEFLKVKSGNLHSFCHANGKYHIMGVVLSAAGSLNWWINNILKREDFRLVLQEMSIVKKNNLYFLPYLSGERSPINDPFACGIFYGLKASHTTADMTRAIIEGVSFSLLDCLMTLKGLGIENNKARVIGGGSKSEAWLQMLADCLGMNVYTLNTKDGGSLGAIILAMVGCSEFSSVKDACKALISDENHFQPNLEMKEYYQKKFIYYKKIYSLTKKINKEI